MIGAALRSLEFCDEIVVVVDARSADRTEEIARQYADKVLVEPFEDFAQIRNAGVRAANGAWILHIDADERITPALAREIRSVLASDPDVLAFNGPTINFFWGRRMDHGGWSPMYQPRLVRREHASFSGRVHESADVPPERIGTLAGRALALLASFDRGEPRQDDPLRPPRGTRPVGAGARRVTPWSFVRVMALEFGRRMVRRAGFRDGMPGTIEGIFQPFALFCAR